jgi:hypothetical protein
MPKIRKLNTAKRKKERKKAKEALKQKTSLFLDMPEKCCVCETGFDKKSKEMAQTWHVVVFEERKVVRLTCPPCWQRVESNIGEINAT